MDESDINAIIAAFKSSLLHLYIMDSVEAEEKVYERWNCKHNLYLHISAYDATYVSHLAPIRPRITF